MPILIINVFEIRNIKMDLLTNKTLIFIFNSYS